MGLLHRAAWLAIGLLVAEPALSQSPTIIGNATAWRDFTTAGRQAVELQALTLDRGCGSKGCEINVGEYILNRDRGRIRKADGRSVTLKDFPEGEHLPPLDWEPLGAYSVRQGSRLWGVCLEMQHAGIGKSGRLQRWTSVVLLPSGKKHR